MTISRRQFSLLFPSLALWWLDSGRAEELPRYSSKQNLLVYQDNQGREHPVKTAEEWTRRREHILAAMQEVMGPMPDGSRKVSSATEYVEEVTTDRYVRRKITFAVEKGGTDSYCQPSMATSHPLTQIIRE